MKYPEIAEIRRKAETISALGGYNHNDVISDGEFYDTENVTQKKYPVLSPRGRRGILASSDNIGAMIAKSSGDTASLIYTDGENLRRDNGTLLMSGLSALPIDLPKKLVAFGTKVLIFPDRKYFDYRLGGGYGDIDHTVTVSSGAVFVTRCNADGDALTPLTSGKVPPANPENGAYWYDTSVTPAEFKIYSSVTGTWQAIVNSYVRITALGLESFEEGDTVEISGIPDTNDLKVLNGQKFVLQKVVTTSTPEGDSGYIVIACNLEKDGSVACGGSVNVSFERKMRDFNFAFECGNRLWICRFRDEDGGVVNEIRASKLGDYKNFDSFEGTAMDSYAVSVASDGRFTGAAAFGGYPMFFKENTIYKIRGTQPSNYQLIETTAPGVQNGSDKSIAVVGGILIYKGVCGIYSYDGTYPVDISKALGDVSYSDAAAGAIGGLYYISMKNPAGKYDMFVYDTSRRMWMREDGTHVTQFCASGGELYALTGGKIRRTQSDKDTDEGALHFWAETGILGRSTSPRKYVSALSVRMSLAAGASMRILIKYDSCGDWESLCYIPAATLRTFSVPVRPKRCDHFRLRFEGVGEGKIYSITKYTEAGSDEK